MRKDFLDEIIAEATARNPDFSRLYAEARTRRAKLRSLRALRTQRGLSQAQVAARMKTSQPVVARLESGEVDTKLSTLEAYAAAIGGRLNWDVTFD